MNFLVLAASFMFISGLTLKRLYKALKNPQIDRRKNLLIMGAEIISLGILLIGMFAISIK